MQHVLGSGGHDGIVGAVPAQCPECVEDDGDVDRFLQQRAQRRGQPAERGTSHGHQRQPHADRSAFDGNVARPACDFHRIGEAVESIGGQDDVRGLRTRRRPASAHGDSHRRGGERRGVVDAVAHHHGHRRLSFAAHSRHFVRGGLLGVDTIETENRPDLLGGLTPVPGEHHQPGQAGGPQSSQCSRRVSAQWVDQQDGTGELAVDSDPCDDSAVESAAGEHGACPLRCLRRQRQCADRHPVPVDGGRHARAGFLDYVGGIRQHQSPHFRFLHQGGGEDVG
ncbi:hypothetical protein MLGJGCBP_08187 [Rhodococcus sp. T7]|nr:hypothetical protein MLGJGCBP_08187 [Rhodococcus sp. T7]